MTYPLPLLEDSKIPPLCVAPGDYRTMQEGLEPILKLLEQTRNVGAWAEWLVGAGESVDQRWALAKQSPLLVIPLSPKSLVNTWTRELICNIRPAQRILFIVTEACMYRVMIPECNDNQRIFPRVGNDIVPINEMPVASAGWQQVAEAIFAEFPQPLP